jgi:uncharacterized coiled-coil protein SlyX
MSFTVSDFDDLKRLLGEHPEWRVELRRLLLTDDMEALPGIVRELAEAQRRAEERLAGVEDRLTRLEEVVRELAEAQRVAEVRLGMVEEHLRRLTDKVGLMDGTMLELDYARKVPGYFGPWLRQASAVDLGDLWDQLESRLGHEETKYALLADLVVRGRVARLADRPDAYLIVEISAVIDENDIERAIVRTESFRRAGLPAIPAVAGREATREAKALAETRGVAMLEDGKESYWDQALAHWPAA